MTRNKLSPFLLDFHLPDLLLKELVTRGTIVITFLIANILFKHFIFA